MSGEVVVAGMVTGVHYIEDIQVSVGHRDAVRIPAEVAYRSKDLWRAIQQGFLFKLSAGSGFVPNALPAPSPPPVDSGLQAEVERLRAENQRLTTELETERTRNGTLQTLLTSLTSGLQGVQEAIGKLESSPRVVVAGPGATAAVEAGVVGGDAPTFVPGRIQPTNVETQIRTEKETTDSSNISSAASRLRELRRGGGG